MRAGLIGTIPSSRLPFRRSFSNTNARPSATLDSPRPPFFHHPDIRIAHQYYPHHSSIHTHIISIPHDPSLNYPMTTRQLLTEIRLFLVSIATITLILHIPALYLLSALLLLFLRYSTDTQRAATIYFLRRCHRRYRHLRRTRPLTSASAMFVARLDATRQYVRNYSLARIVTDIRASIAALFQAAMPPPPPPPVEKKIRIVRSMKSRNEEVRVLSRGEWVLPAADGLRAKGVQTS